MPNGSSRRDVARFGYGSALALAIGVLLSGPLTVFAVSRVAPQPIEWQGIEAYARASSPLQMLTYGFGFLIVLGAIGVIAALHALAPPEGRLYGVLALVFAAMFGSIISMNYMLQLAVLRPHVAAGRLGGMALLAFENPDSVTMALEMLGYGFLGLATLSVAPLLAGGAVGRWARGLGVANGVFSVAGTVLQATGGCAASLGSRATWSGTCCSRRWPSFMSCTCEASGASPSDGPARGSRSSDRRRAVASSVPGA